MNVNISENYNNFRCNNIPCYKQAIGSAQGNYESLILYLGICRGIADTDSIVGAIGDIEESISKRE